MANKINVLIWADYACATGFATVSGNIARELEKSGKYDIDVLGINYSGDPYDQKKWPGNLFPAMPGIMSQAPSYNDVYGRQRLLDLMGSGKYDVVFMIQDTFILQTIIDEVLKTQEGLAKHPVLKSFKTVYYFPIDARPKPDWATQVVAKVDFPVAYTNYARTEVSRYAPELKDIPVIYHGTNLTDFHPVEDKKAIADFKHNFFNDKLKDKFVIMNINRNQPRKDPARMFMVMKELKARGVDAIWYLHMQYADIGGNLFVMAEQMDLGNDDEFMLPSPNIFNANQGISVEDLNMVYACADMIFTSTLGEGWGLSLTEAMATKKPIVAPNHTSITEILADNRGYLVDAGVNPSDWIVKENDLERYRPLMDVKKAADAIERIYNGELPDVEGAYKWVQNLSWENITKQWMEVIDKAALAAAQANQKRAVPDFLPRAERRRLEREGKKQ